MASSNVQKKAYPSPTTKFRNEWLNHDSNVCNVESTQHALYGA